MVKLTPEVSQLSMIGLWTEGLTDLPKTISLVSASLTSTLILPFCTTALEAQSKSRENGGCASTHLGPAPPQGRGGGGAARSHDGGSSEMDMAPFMPFRVILVIE